MNFEDLRSITLSRSAKGTYHAENVRGGRLTFGDGGTSDFTPVELLLTAMAGCSAVDVDYLTSRLVRFPEGAEGDPARERLPDAVAKSRDRLCTVARTVQLPTPVRYVTT